MILISCILQWVFSGALIVIGYLILISWHKGIWKNPSWYFLRISSNKHHRLGESKLISQGPLQSYDLRINNKWKLAFLLSTSVLNWKYLMETRGNSYLFLQRLGRNKYAYACFINQQSHRIQIFQPRSHNRHTSTKQSVMVFPLPI